MSALTVKDCIGYLKYILTELIPIARNTDMHVMVDEIIILKDYVNLINDISLSIGTILYQLVNHASYFTTGGFKPNIRSSNLYTGTSFGNIVLSPK